MAIEVEVCKNCNTPIVQMGTGPWRHGSGSPVCGVVTIYAEPGGILPEIKATQHCTSEEDECYSFSHTAGYCGRPQPRRCGCAFCYPED